MIVIEKVECKMYQIDQQVDVKIGNGDVKKEKKMLKKRNRTGLKTENQNE